MKQIADKITTTKQEIAGLCFSERYTDAPPGSEASTPKYTLEVKDRIWKVTEQFGQLVSRKELSKYLLGKLPKPSVVNPTIKPQTDPCSVFRISLQPLANEIRSALQKAQGAFQETLEGLFKSHPSTKDLPILRNFILMHITGQVNGWIQKEIDTIPNLLDREGVEPLAVQAPCRTTVTAQIQSVILRMSEADECAICHDTMLSEAPVDLLHCCSTHFHQHCLNEAFKKTSFQPSCPLCRASQSPIPKDKEESERAKVQHKMLQEAAQRMMEHAKKSMTIVIHKIQAVGVKLGCELEKNVSDSSGPKNLLDECPNVALRRKSLRDQLGVLQQVEEEVNAWVEL